MSLCELKHSIGLKYSMLDSTAVSIFVDILVELTNTVSVSVFVNSASITTNNETAALSTFHQIPLKMLHFFCTKGPPVLLAV